MAGWADMAGGVAGGVIGGVAGGAGDPTNGRTDTTTTTQVNLRDFDSLNQGRSGLEANAYNAQNSGLANLQNLMGLGPGANEVSSNLSFQNQFAQQLQSLLQKATNPNQSDIASNFSKAQQLFAPQQTALNQQFVDQNIANQRLSARLGRAGNDPILQNKMRTEQTRQQSTLNSEIGSYGQQLPMINANNAMQIGGALSNLRGGLATQAFQNQQMLVGMGNQLSNAERQYRLQAAGHSQGQTAIKSELKGGGLKDIIGGALGGMGQLGPGIASMFAGGGAAGGGFGAMAGGAGDAIATAAPAAVALA